MDPLAQNTREGAHRCAGREKQNFAALSLSHFLQGGTRRWFDKAQKNKPQAQARQHVSNKGGAEATRPDFNFRVF